MSSNERHEFQSEAKQVLELMIHSVYSNPDIFLRELISNASDAIDKLRIEGLSDEKLSGLAADGRITVTLNAPRRTITVSDNGIGMTKDDLVSYLGTIAKSGTSEFIRALQESSAGRGDLIGQFGVGFYSSFIVSDRVAVVTKRAGSDEAWQWESEGDATYTISSAEKESYGTDIILHIKEREPDEDSERKDYLTAWTLREIIKKYSDFVTYPIYLEDAAKDKEKEKKEEQDSAEDFESKPVNSMKAIWIRPEEEVSDEEYKEFYGHISHDWEDPLERIVYRAEGTNEFHALLFIPKRPPFDLFYREGRHGVQLYIRRVFIMNDNKDLIPEYLRFVKGVVDSEDLSLNISREILQQDRLTAMIKRSVTRKVLDALKRMSQDEPEKYGEFWKAFGIVLKEGILSDTRNKDQIMKLSLFDSTKGAGRSLDEYVGSMKEGQKGIYYLTGTSAEALSDSPKLEAFVGQDIEVLLLSDPVDEIWVGMAKFGDCDLISISSDEADLPQTEDEAEREEVKKLEDTGVLGRLKEALGGKIEDVKFSGRLVDSPVTFVQKGMPISQQMRSMFKAMGQEAPKEEKILELNPAHPLIRKIAEDTGDLSAWGTVLMGLAAISDGEPIDNGKDFTKKLSDLLQKE